MTTFMGVLTILSMIVLSAWAYTFTGALVLRWIDLWLGIDQDDEPLSLILLMVWPAFVVKLIYWRLIYGPPERE